MTAIDTPLVQGRNAPARGNPLGPVTIARQRRTWTIYAVLLLAGLMPLVLGSSAAWRAAGLGLWMPGAGFLAVGGWALALFPVTFVLFVASLVAWFWAGMVLLPVAVWLGAAVIAGAMAGPETMPGAHFFAAAAMAGVALFFRTRIEKRRDADLAKGAGRTAYAAASLAEVEEMAARVPDPRTRELAADDLMSVRYILDRALQPVDGFAGFNIIDQFQPAALRYQINHLGFALGVYQGAYCPNFSGYLREAQRNLIDKYRVKKVWDYWVYESCWGHLNFTNFDPADRDNIMLTGWYGMHVGQYMLNSGDLSYGEKGALTFRLSERTAYEHDFHTIIGSVVSNYETAEFGLFACEPNWLYPICNHYGMGSLAVHDAIYGTRHVATHLPNWLDKLDTEFTDQSGTIIGLRSQLTGFEFPFPTGEAGYAPFSDIFVPERARLQWAIARKEIEPALVRDETGREYIHLPGRGLDAGNYRPGHVPAFASILVAAREFGDERFASAALASLEKICEPKVAGGVRHYATGSNLANAVAVMGHIARTGDFRRSFVEGPPAETREGPLLSDARYPDVLVARAYSNGRDLELVLHPGVRPGERHELGLSRLRPDARYWIEGGVAKEVVADPAGNARIEIVLDGRTDVKLVLAV